MISEIKKELRKEADKNKAKILAGYFKTGKGEYGEGDVFLGIVVPEQRKIAKKFSNLPLSEIQKLLNSKIHEHRFTALEILVMQFAKSNEKDRKNILNFYLKNKKYVINWDLVDTSAPYLLGEYLVDKPKEVLYKLAKSKNLWERRIAIVSTFYFISKGDVSETFKIAKVLLHDRGDLIHKAVGWALREAGKKNERKLVKFLEENGSKMPRTMFRYAIEKFSLTERKRYLARF